MLEINIPFALMCNLFGMKSWQHVCNFQHIYIMTDSVLSMTLSCGHKNPEIYIMTDSGHSMTLSCGHKNLQHVCNPEVYIYHVHEFWAAFSLNVTCIINQVSTETEPLHIRSYKFQSIIQIQQNH